MDLHAAGIVVVAALVTIALRFLPFMIFGGGGRQTPAYITYLGKVLPFAIMGMLVVFCLKGISLTSAPFGAPELLACVLTGLLHVWRRNTLISIAGGTIIYMILVQMVF